MRFEEWEPVYASILEDFGYPRAADEAARDRLGTLAEPFDWDRLTGVSRMDVAVAGGADTMADELDVVRSADVVFAASAAAEIIRDRGHTVDLMTTDLDKVPNTAVELTREGTPVAVHAHGDNVDQIEKWVPRMDIEHVLPTTQAEPVPPVENVGGFTDGDRAAFLADHLGAASLRFPGWDFDDATVGPEKRRKLKWAERLLHWLERRRGQTFDLLDGRRDAIEVIGG